ncbi:CPBP family intramembrane glutamic endopeptidase [Halobellus limi]|uniref:CPBP family intramembrane metalloprotease n=1 Tax=Halobellus limi TaxID=699433 RepID=A0A1H5YW47_9EURY|nr:type II CAAX endopeptidase family protein [Halobellus limi]QCC48337.1 CPBP family intramembrane metalloprotease [Halobellus limi]SEG27466.1 Membrane protease YdiL, CAAX protease family [Halobellus limi]
MPQWATFAGFAIVVTAGLLLLSHASRAVLDGAPTDERVESANHEPDGPSGNVVFDDGDARGDGTVVDPDDRGRVADDADRADRTTDGADRPDRLADGTDEAASDRDEDGETIVLPKSGVELQVTDSHDRGDGSRSIEGRPAASDLSAASLLANVALSQGLFGALLLAGAWYAEIPARAFGVASETTTAGSLAIGVGLGLALYAANEAGAAAGARFGLGEGDRLRSALAPDSAVGWAALLFVVLPVIAGFEELLFRGALVGVLAAGYDVSPWALALLSSVAFGFGHGAQGRIGVLVTGALGFVLAAAFVATGSLLVVVVAHYLVNALEFVVHEGLGVEWPRDAA